MMISGVYSITNTKTGTIYVGSSVDIASRWMSEAQRGHGVPIALREKWSRERTGVPWSLARRAAQDRKKETQVSYGE